MCVKTEISQQFDIDFSLLKFDANAGLHCG